MLKVIIALLWVFVLSGSVWAQENEVPPSLAHTRDKLGNLRQTVVISPSTPTPIPVANLLSEAQNGHLAIQHTRLGNASVTTIFDENPKTAIVCDNRPTLIRLNFKSPITLSTIRLGVTGSAYRWAVYLPASNAKLEIGHAPKLAGTTVNSNTGDVSANLARPVTTRSLMLVIRCSDRQGSLKLASWELMRDAVPSAVHCDFQLKFAATAYPGWKVPMALTATFPDGEHILSLSDAHWRNETPEIARVENGFAYAQSPGVARFTVTVGGATAAFTFEVQKPSLPPFEQALLPELTKPADKALWEVPFVVICYFPTQDGITVDKELTDCNMTVRDLYNRTLRFVIDYKAMVEEASRFHGYKDANALPSLGYRCVKYITYFEDVPRGYWDKRAYYPDYAQIIERENAKKLVEEQGVKEFWVFQWHHGMIAPMESKMSSPKTPDISNSISRNDLPNYKSTYLMYGFNFNRGPVLHVLGHQMEAMLFYAAAKQDKNADLFGRQFVGLDAQGKFQRGRAGNVHFPPNGTFDYDYRNDTPIMSDIEDWNALGTGHKTPVSRDTWESLPYQFPSGNVIEGPNPLGETERNWMIYWFQNMPGRDAHVAHPKGEMTNWWRFLGDWDGAVRDHYGLWHTTH